MLAYFNTSVSHVRLPSTVEDFITKIIDKVFNEQESHSGCPLDRDI